MIREIIILLLLSVRFSYAFKTNKIVCPNNYTVEDLRNLHELNTTAIEAIQDLVKIDAEYIQYYKLDGSDTSGLLLKTQMHPFVEAVHLAYSDHLPLIITPDMIWYLISNGISTYVNKHSQEVRNVFVNFTGKTTIDVRRDNFKLNSSNPWDEVIDEFVEKINKNTNPNTVSLLRSDFTTTSNVSKVVSEIVVMDMMKSYFDYSFSSMCSIPEIRIAGNKSDWMNVKMKTLKSVELIPNLKVWLDSGLSYVLDKFIDVFDDKIDNDFWNQIYKVNDGSGGPFISGWILTLFPYSRGNENYYVWESTWKEAGYNYAGLTTSNFDYHMNQVPFIWNYFSQRIKMLFVGGLFGVRYNKDKSLEPVFGYAVMEDKTNFY